MLRYNSPYISMCERKNRLLVCTHTYTSNTFQMGDKKTCSAAPPPFPVCSIRAGWTDSHFAEEGSRVLRFSWTGMKQKALCSWIWVWVRRRVCVCVFGDCCAEQYMVYRRGVSEPRGSCQRCLSVMAAPRSGTVLKVMCRKYCF